MGRQTITDLPPECLLKMVFLASLKLEQYFLSPSGPFKLNFYYEKMFCRPLQVPGVTFPQKFHSINHVSRSKLPGFLIHLLNLIFPFMLKAFQLVLGIIPNWNVRTKEEQDYGFLLPLFLSFLLCTFSEPHVFQSSYEDLKSRYLFIICWRRLKCDPSGL